MKQKFGYTIILGLVIGVLFGMGMGAASGNPLFGIGLGALFGVFIGWYVAVAVLKYQNKNIKDE